MSCFSSHKASHASHGNKIHTQTPKHPKKKKKNKPRLTLALYHRPKHPGTYHYALLLTPKPTDPPTSTRGDPSNPSYPLSVPKFHVKNTIFRDESKEGKVSQAWRYERGEVKDIETEAGLHVLVTVGKICEGVEVLDGILRGVPIDRQDEGKEGGEEFDCVSWTKAAFEKLREEAILTGKSGVTGRVVGWEELKEEAEAFAVQMMGSEREEVGWMGEEGTPCWDILDGRVIAMT